MATSLHLNNLELQHQANIATSLAHRLEVARAERNWHLVELLEREGKQVSMPSSVQHDHHPLLANVKHWWQELVETFAHSSDLRIWQTTDKSGMNWWHAYNPITGQGICTDSETEMRIWIEANYVEE